MFVSLLWLAGEAQGWVQAGPCRLHAYPPAYGSGGWQAQGKADTCGGGWLGLRNEHRVTLEVCLWYNPGRVWVSLGCRTHSDTLYTTAGVASMWVFSPRRRVPRHTRVKSYGYEKADGFAASMTSSSVPVG